MTEINRIGFIGAGLMGFGMAKCLLKNGLEVNVLPHKNPEPIEKLKNLGARVAKDYRDLLLDTNGLISCLPNAEIVEKLAKELVTEFKPGMFWIDTTTSKPATSKKIAVLLQEKGVFFADAPVTGGPAQSIEGQLASLVGCDQDDFPKVEEIVGLFSKVVRHFGVVGSGNIAKLLNNLVSQGMVILLADAFLSAEIMGVNRQALYDVMEAGAVRSGTLEKMVKPYLSGNYDGSQFSITNALKDLRYVNELMNETLPGHVGLTDDLIKRLERQVNEGRGSSYVSNLLKQNYILNP